MKKKDNIFIIIFIIGAFIGIWGKETWVGILGVLIVCACFVASYSINILKWNKKRKQLKDQYIKTNVKNFVFEIIFIICMYMRVITSYTLTKAVNSEKIEISNFSQYINTIDSTERFMLFIIIGFMVGALLLIIEKIICRTRISSEEILFSSGEITKIKDIKKVDVEDSSFGFNKKITVYFDNKVEIIHLNNSLYEKNFKEILR